jgi:hypothetical protein
MDYCKAMASGAVSHILGKRRCMRKTWKDGFCQLHHPDTIKAKDAAKRKKYDEQTENMRLARALEAAEKRVIRAAVRWVNVNDLGSLDDLRRLANAQLELGRAVEALEKARKNV